MTIYKKYGTIVGLLFIIATAAPLLTFPFSGFILENPDLMTVAEKEIGIIIGSILELIMCLAIAGIAIWAYPVLKRQSQGLALSYVGARLFEGFLLLMATVPMLLLLTLSPESPFAQEMNGLLIASREWLGQIGSIFFGVGALILYSILIKSKTVPLWISIWGLIGALLAFAEGLLLMFGVIEPMATTDIVICAPVAINEMVLAVWLIIKGFKPITQNDGQF